MPDASGHLNERLKDARVALGQDFSQLRARAAMVDRDHRGLTGEGSAAGRRTGGSPRCQPRRGAPTELAADRWALDLPGTYLGELVPRQGRLEGFEPIVGGRFSSYAVQLAHVAAGLTGGVLPELAATPRPGLVRRPTMGLADRRIVAAMRRANRGRPAAIAVIETLRQTAGQSRSAAI